MLKNRQFIKKAILIIVILVVFLLMIFIMRSNRTVLIADQNLSDDGTENKTPASVSTSSGNVDETVTPSEGDVLFPVHIAGAVKRPGVYFFQTGDIADQAVLAAGGLKEDADMRRINLAAELKPHEHLYIQSKDESDELPAPVNVEETALGVSINSATAEELMTLPGIGKAKAEAIIRYREENGLFREPEDLMKVPGIKQGSFDKLKDYIRM